MQISHLSPGWGKLIAVLLWCVLATSLGVIAAQNDGSSSTSTTQGTCSFIAKKVKFSEFAKTLAEENGINLVISAPADDVIDVNYSDVAPLQILSTTAKSIGLDFWKVGDTYFIGRHNTDTTKPTIDPLPVAASQAPDTGITVKPAVNTMDSEKIDPAPKQDKPIIDYIELSYTSASDWDYMFGLSGAVEAPDLARRQVLERRAESLIAPNNPVISPDAGGAYRSPALNSPWLNGNAGKVTGQDSTTDSRQFPMLNGMGTTGLGQMGGYTSPAGTGFTTIPVGGTPTSAYGAPAYGTTPYGTAPYGTAGAAGGAINPAIMGGGIGGVGMGNAQMGVAGGRGILRPFLPDGIQDVVGILGLNTLMVRARSQESIDQLRELIMRLDKPVKQAVVELMFVDMSVDDVQSLGVNFDLNGSPLAITNAPNANSGSTLSLRYLKGSLRATLNAALSTGRHKVVTAPRLVVQNNSTASILSQTEIPFVTVTQTEDVFGRTISTPSINMQTFSQGMTVNRIVITPDNYVILTITPQLQSVGTQVGLGGSGSGSVSGSNGLNVTTTVRVKSGETVIMGGMVNRSDTNQANSTPLLGNLPIVGPLLFKAQQNSNNDEETMIFITPTVMEDDTTNFGSFKSLTPLF